MAGLNEDAQWIVMMGFVVSFSLFFLAMILNQSTVVGQTTAEGVLEFPKNDIRDVRSAITGSSALSLTDAEAQVIKEDIRTLALNRKGAVVDYTITPPTGSDLNTRITIHYNNGVTEYNEIWTSP